MYRIAIVALLSGVSLAALPVNCVAQSTQVTVDGQTYRTPLDIDSAGSIFLSPRPARPGRPGRPVREGAIREPLDPRPARPERPARSAFNSGSPAGFYQQGTGTDIVINSNNSDGKGFGSLATAEQISVLQQQLANGQLQGEERLAIQNAIELLKNQ